MIREMDAEKRIRYVSPDIAALCQAGYAPVDMHLHTTHSDGLTRTPDLIRYMRKNQIGVAITDHNEISGVVQAFSLMEKGDPLLIPGIELETKEGPHLLIYCSTLGELQDFYDAFSRRRNGSTVPQNLPVSECLDLAEPYAALRIAAHPFGYFGINRGVLKCVEKQMLPGVLEHIDGIEAICGGLFTSLNKKAIQYAESHPIPVTGGSDAHILPDVGSVITAASASTTEEFLDKIRKRENIVVGRPSGYLHKGMTAGVIAWSFLPYTAGRLEMYCRALRRSGSPSRKGR